MEMFLFAFSPEDDIEAMRSMTIGHIGLDYLQPQYSITKVFAQPRWPQFVAMPTTRLTR
jgi:hypothetical protein